MATLITGGAGFIGSHMVLEMLDNGLQPVVLDNLTTGFRGAIPADVPLIVGDIGDVELLDNVFSSNKIDSIFHFAGKLCVPESVAEPIDYYKSNTVKSHALIAAAIRHKIRHFIFSSTAAVYGNAVTDLVHEDDPLAPLSPYGSSKWMTECILRDAAAAYNFKYVALRYFNVAGADPQGRAGQSLPNATHLLKVTLQAALGQRPCVEVFGHDYPTPDGTGIRDYIHVSDLVAAHLDALRYLQGGGESIVCNCGYGTGSSVLEVIDAVRRAVGHDFPTHMGPRRAGDPASVVANASRIRQRLGWRPRFDSLDTIVEHTLAWERRLRQRGV